MSEKLTPSHPKLPTLEHTVEVDKDTLTLSINKATFHALGEVDRDNIDQKAAEIGITVDSGIIPIDVEGERRYINTSREDFGTSVRNVLEKQTEASESSLRARGSQVLRLAAGEEAPIEAEADIEEQRPTKEVVIISADTFNRDIDQIMSNYVDQSQGTETSLSSAAAELQTSTHKIRHAFEESEQQMNVVMRSLYDGQVDTGDVTRRLMNVQDVIMSVRAVMQNQLTLIDDGGQFTRQLQASVEETATALQTRVSQFSAEVGEQIHTAEKDGTHIDDSQVEIALSKATHTGFMLRRMEESVDSTATGLRRLQNDMDDAAQGIHRIIMMNDELMNQLRYGRTTHEDLENLYRVVHMTASGHDEQARVSIARFTGAIDELSSARRSVASTI